MIITDAISFILLSILLFWTVYNGSIIYVGVKSRRKQAVVYAENTEVPKFSIIVPTKDEELVISRCLSGIMDLDYPKEKLEIIVVDGNSTDKTRSICSEFEQKYRDVVRIIYEKESNGKPAALNLALHYVTGEIVGVFDADSVPEKDVLRKVASRLH